MSALIRYKPLPRGGNKGGSDFHIPFKINYLSHIIGGGTVPRTIIWINTVKSYLIDYNSIFYALNTLPDLLRPAVICYFVVGSVVGR